jgi:glycosyltransferase involved in cell wall biosynthesis
VADGAPSDGEATAGDGVAPTPRVAVVGISVNRFCGVRDHATLLAAELERRGVPCSMHWLSRTSSGLGASRREVREWAAGLGEELSAAGADVVLLHYSVFSYCYRGVPLFVAPTLAAIDRAGVSIVVVGHELAYPWHHAGLRGKLWAIAQRPALRQLVRRASGVIVTADFRAQWLGSRWWLPRRAVLVAPVFSNLPAPRAASGGEVKAGMVGLFGYAYGGVAVDAVLDALARLPAAKLRLLGSPGPDSAAGEAWRADARSRRIEDALSFSGELPAQELSDEMARCAVLLFADVSGPSSRKGTLAGALASGRPLVAIDGPLRWQLLVDSDAARVVEPTADALAQALGELLSDTPQADALGARGREFAEREMGVARTAEAVLALVGQTEATGATGAAPVRASQLSRAER